MTEYRKVNAKVSKPVGPETIAVNVRYVEQPPDEPREFRLESAEVSPLSQLARRINAEHAEAFWQMRSAIMRAIGVGELLSQAKAQVKHGEWTSWVEANCQFGARQAQKYLRAYENRAALEANANSDSLSTIDGALAAIAEPARKATDEDGLSDEEWVASLPLASKLEGDALARLRFRAWWWRKCLSGRDHAVGLLESIERKASKSPGDVAMTTYLRTILDAPHPRDWREGSPALQPIEGVDW